MKQAHITLDKLPMLHGNPGLIRLLFHNLINNALKYSKANVPPEISIRVDHQPNGQAGGEAPQKYCRILVQDNGMGFDQKYAEEVFGMFKRLHTEVKLEGTGIGLALCKKIAEHHKGHISALSKTGEGSTFIVSLPIESKEEFQRERSPVVTASL
jgi:light-regulated signal transduction histidine kinase (bacteriophytochrome)